MLSKGLKLKKTIKDIKIKYNLISFQCIFLICTIIGILFSLTLVSCGKKEESMNLDESKCSIYYIKRDETLLVPKEYIYVSGVLSERLGEVINKISTESGDISLISPIDDDMEIKEYYLDDAQAVINFSSKYSELEQKDEILIRSAIVKSLTSIDGIETVSFLVEGKPFLLQSGKAAGAMRAEDYIVGDDFDENGYNEIDVNLYFADRMGNTLIKYSTRMDYNQEESIEKQVLQKLIMGPLEDNIYPVINPEIVINSVNVKDGICTVDFSEQFFNEPYNVSTDVAIYSVVNTLTELNNITGVYFTINGSSSELFQNKYALTECFEYKGDLVQN